MVAHLFSLFGFHYVNTRVYLCARLLITMWNFLESLLQTFQCGKNRPTDTQKVKLGVKRYKNI